MNIKLNCEGDHSLVVYGDSEEQPYATARVAYVDSPAVPRQSVSTIRARCHERGEVMDGGWYRTSWTLVRAGPMSRRSTSARPKR